MECINCVDAVLTQSMHSKKSDFIYEIASSFVSRRTPRNDANVFYSLENVNFGEGIDPSNKYRQEDGVWHESQA